MFVFVAAMKFISVSTSGYIPPNGRMINDEVERTWKEAFIS
jgi:hypothetical protein